MKRGAAAKSAGSKTSGGVPSSRASDAAERSPAVYFANLKADMLLQKQRQVLKRAENSLVHRIVIDQKILFRRFQAKLRRSKLARARLWGDKETERQLRARDLRVMNTNCGQEQDDTEFLKRLHNRPCLVDHPKWEDSKTPGCKTQTPPVTDKDMEDLIRTVLDEEEPPHTEKTLHSLSTIGRLLEEARLVSSAESGTRQGGGKSRNVPKVTIRPVTTPGLKKDLEEETALGNPHTGRRIPITERDENLSSRGKIAGRNQSGTKSSQTNDLHPGTDKNRPRPLTSPVRGSESRTKPKHASLKSPHPSSPISRTKSAQGNLSLGTSSPGHSSRRPSQAASSMFEEQKKIDVVALRLAEARSADYAPRVSAFIQTLLELDRKERRRSLKPEAEPGRVDANFGPEGNSSGELPPEPERRGEEKEEGEEERKEELKGDRKFDYYATKMALYAASVKKAPPTLLPGTPEEVNMRLVGDQSVKSITMPPLRLYHDPAEQGRECVGGGPGECADVDQDSGGANVLTVHQEA